MKRFGLTMAAALLTIGVSGTAFGQAQPGQPGGAGAQPGQPGQPGGNRGQRGNGGGNFDPAQMRAQYMTRLKEQLGANDDEWKVLEPKLTKVMDASRAARSTGGFGGGGFTGGRTRGGNNGGAPATPPPVDPNATPVQKASAELRAVVDKKDAAASEYTEKLAAYRAAREKAKTDQAAAEKELKEVLTPKQEAILVSSGTIS